jgi:YEATS domain-containing protein 4
MRAKGFTATIPFVYGSSARLVNETDVLADPSHSHKWTIYLKGHNGQDLSCYIKKVVFKLHESFAVPVRTFEKPPYEVTETGTIY